MLSLDQKLHFSYPLSAHAIEMLLIFSELLFDAIVVIDWQTRFHFFKNLVQSKVNSNKTNQKMSVEDGATLMLIAVADEHLYDEIGNR